VYHADNDVADHQVTSLEFANGVRASLTVNGLTADNTRLITMHGTRGELRGRLDTGELEVRRFLPGAAIGAGPAWDRDGAGWQAMRDDERILLDVSGSGDGHAGGDDAMVADVVARLHARRDGPDGTVAAARTSLAESVDSHLMAFAAERSRHERRIVVPGE
jgi:hypothetical protein